MKEDLQAPLVLIVLGVGSAFTIGLISLGYYSFFAPKYQAVERKVFEESPSFVQGKILNLTRLEMQYKAEKDPDSRAAIAALIKLEASTLKEDYIPATLGTFIDSL